jgi:hypothetical protein
MARVVKQVNFKDGVYLHGTVLQSVGLAPAGEEMPRSLTGVSLVTKIGFHEKNVGLVIFMKGRTFVVPWAAIASWEEAEEEVPAPAKK